LRKSAKVSEDAGVARLGDAVGIDVGRLSVAVG